MILCVSGGSATRTARRLKVGDDDRRQSRARRHFPTVKVENGEASGFGPRRAGLGWHAGEGRENMLECGLGGKGGGPVWPEREGKRKRKER
jgi:hypothetical protein